ncbi:unnamed protein product [Schistocephalus solidus]|uniref:Glycine amidinotransferase n=2 Tax=Schistocephalus solidus TaxID=70667 RepID=A0A183T833_SCHSO|nr:unnamed protein product [Schistocephalus solidus]
MFKSLGTSFSTTYLKTYPVTGRRLSNSGAFQSYSVTTKSSSHSSPVCSWNEWDPLEAIIVGTPEGATVPKLLPEVKACTASQQWKFFEENAGKLWADSIPRKHWQKLEDNIKGLVLILQNEGIEVVRPTPIDFQKEYQTTDFKSTGFYAAMPRDFLLIVGDEIIEATMTWRSRFFEYVAYRPLIIQYWRDGAQWTTAPKPICGSNLIDKTYEAIDEVHRNSLMNSYQYVTTESEPCFDAADFIRAGRDIFAQRSQVTNLAGIDWLRRHLAPKGIRVHQLTFRDARPMHIDATFCLVKPGLAIQNPDRPCDQAEILRAAGWKVVNAPPPLIKDDHPLWLGSKWLSMNTIMLDEKRVLVEKEETTLQELYRANGVTPIPVSMRYANSIGGGFHCWTSDIRRRGGPQSYFDWSCGGIPETLV